MNDIKHGIRPINANALLDAMPKSTVLLRHQVVDVICNSPPIDVADTIDALEAAQAKWISVNDDLPAHVITPCLIYANGDIETACWTHDKYGFAWWFFVDGEYETGVTHWMPLPEPPKVRA